jgi:hypothetical protein
MNTHAQWLERPALFVVVLVGFYFVVLANTGQSSASRAEIRFNAGCRMAA